MRKISILATAALAIFAFSSCTKTSVEPNAGLSSEDQLLVKNAGFNSNWAEKTADGHFIVENDYYFTRAELQEMAGQALTNNIIVGGEEHYRTSNLVTVPSSGYRTITVRLASGFPSYYSTALNSSITRYNNLNLRIRFQRVTSGGNIVISAANLGTSGGGCVLGRSSGFPTGGNPAPGFTLSTNSCATSYLNTTTKVDEVIAHEIGHTIGFRHTDYATRGSCGQNVNEGSSGVGAVHIPGTPTGVSGSYNSWMMACTNGDATITSTDGVALNYVY